jgi:hypothetical protein
MGGRGSCRAADHAIALSLGGTTMTKRTSLILWLGATAALTGCSTSPCADILDHFWPAKPPANAAGAYGGVCNPSPPGPGVAGGPVTPPNLSGPPPGNVITGPPVVPAPGNTGAPPAGGTAPMMPGTASPPPLSSLPAPDLNGTPTSGSGATGQPMPAPPSTTAPPF